MKIKKLLMAGSIAVLGLAAIWTWDPLPANPSAKELSQASEKYDVEIIRDNWGVPHIYGKSDADAVFGFAYAHAEDDYDTIQLSVAATRGVLARYHGKDAAPTDFIVSLFEIWETIDERYDDDIPDNVKEIAQSYADGLNLYAAQNPGSTWQGLAPFTPQDIVAGFMFKTPFFYGLDGVLLELFGDERKQELALDTSANRQAWHVGPKGMSERGSNGIAVSPARSTDNKTRLLINSHQPMTGPVAWYEAQIVSEEGLNMSGGSFPGAPLILHGFNPNLGWANTVSAQDLSDVYVLNRNGKKNEYMLDGNWEKFETKIVPIKVKLFGPFALTVKRKVHRSQHGPVIESKHGTYAIRYAGMGEIRQLEQYYQLNKSNNFTEFMDAMSLNALPSINYIYGDKDGNVAFIHNGQYPDRLEGWDWSKYLPGDRSDLIWQDYLPYSAVPKLVNPKSGLVYNSNNTPYSATDGDDNLTAADFPSTMGLQTNQTNRSLRMMELTDGITKISKDGLLNIKFDHAYSSKSEAAKLIAEVLSIDWSGEEKYQKAAEHLRDWDLELSTTNRHAALGELTVLKALTAEFTHIPAPNPETSFRDAVDYLIAHYGRIDPTWGELNRLVRGDINVAVDGGPDTLRAIYPAEVRDDGTLHANAGDTWIGLVEWDETGHVSADVIHQFGSATLDTSSPHYADQAEMFAKHQWRKALLTPEEVRENASRIYRPTDNNVSK